MTVAANNSLTVNTGLSGTGSLTTSSGSTVTLSGATNSIGTFSNSGTLALGSNTLTVSSDYSNANFGTGNSFNKHANVTGTAPKINAVGTTSQQVGGTAVTGGATATPTLALGNVHVGTTTTQTYRINVGPGGPSLRGAIQTTVNGGNLTDSRLSGAGVTAGNWGPVAQGGGSSNLTVAFNAATAGALTGQAVHIANNFDNVAEQTLSITGAAYNLAAAKVNNAQPVNLGNFHVGGSTASQAISISNSAPAGGFTEGLDASVLSSSGGATASGSVSLLAAGSTNNTAITVGLSGATAGAKSGSVTLGLTSDGTGTSGLGTTALAAETVNVTGTAFNLAQGQVTNAPVDFSIVHVGDTASRALNVSNTAPVGAFTEKLDAAITRASGNATGSGSLTLLAAGQTDSSSLTVGMDTATAGNKSGSVTLGLKSDGTGTSGLGTTDLASQTVQVQGQVNNYALAALSKLSGDGTFGVSGTSYTLDFGLLHQGSGVELGTLDILNAAQVLADTLHGTFSVMSGNGFDLSGSTFDGLGAGQSDSLAVSFDPLSAGSFTEVLDFAWYGYNSSGYQGELQHLALTLEATVADVPEPGTAAVMGTGMLGLFAMLRRRRRQGTVI